MKLAVENIIKQRAVTTLDWRHAYVTFTGITCISSAGMSSASRHSKWKHPDQTRKGKQGREREHIQTVSSANDEQTVRYISSPLPQYICCRLCVQYQTACNKYPGPCILQERPFSSFKRRYITSCQQEDCTLKRPFLVPCSWKRPFLVP